MGLLFLAAGPAVSTAISSHDPGTSCLPADLASVPVEPLGGPSVGVTAALVDTSVPITVVTSMVPSAELLPVSAEPLRGTHGGEDSPPSSEEKEDERTSQSPKVVSSQAVTSPRFSSYLSGVVSAFGTKTSSPTVKRGE